MIIGFPHKPGSGGPGSFQIRLESALKANGVETCYAGHKTLPDIVMVFGGTKRLLWLFRMKMKGVPIVQRLDGISWLHRKKRVGLKKYLLSEYRNWNLKLIHAYFANEVIYQSEFIKKWWDCSGWRKKIRYSIIYNGVDLKEFKPSQNRTSKNNIKIICVEGHIDYSPFAIEMLNQLSERLKKNDMNILVFGGFSDSKECRKLSPNIEYHGIIERNKLPSVYNNAIYLSLDINPACPNAVIEALASGIPVLGFDTGSMKELVSAEAGEIVPYGSNPWESKFPCLENMLNGINKIIADYENYSLNARILAEKHYSIDHICLKYIEAFKEFIMENE